MANDTQVKPVLRMTFEVPVAGDFSAQAKSMESMQAEYDALCAKVKAQHGTAKIGIVQTRAPKTVATQSIHKAA